MGCSTVASIRFALAALSVAAVLDTARYADSNGFQQDGDTWQWIWRDWVVKSLNADMPFDQFSIEQLAGDMLPEATNEQKIATGFNRNHLLNGEGGAIAEEQRFNNLFDRVDTTSTTWLGLTMACAQWHGTSRTARRSRTTREINCPGRW